MSTTSNTYEESVTGILRHTLENTERLLVSNPDSESIAELVEVLRGLNGDQPRIQLLANDRELKRALDDFLIASAAADLIEQGTLSLRTDELSHNTLLITESEVLALVAVEDYAGALAGDEESFVRAVERSYQGRWEHAAQYRLRTPPISRVRETLEAEIGPETRVDFDRFLEVLESTPERAVLDEVMISLLVAAKNEVLLYDISRWGEDVGIASKATFSRTKTQLEEHGLLDTEKVPIDVGRPRLRLQFDEHLANVDTEELVEIVTEELAA